MNTKEFKTQLLQELYTHYKDLDKLYIPDGSRRIIFGEGNPDARILFIGEAPGAQEDIEGRPFVGRSGKLLNNILQLAHVKREDVFITNIVKCRPPNNRRPLPKEMENSKDLLIKQIKIIQPSIICTLGSAALEGLLSNPVRISQVRGKAQEWLGFTVIPTYHPAYILRNPKELQTLANDIVTACQKAA